MAIYGPVARLCHTKAPFSFSISSNHPLFKLLHSTVNDSTTLMARACPCCCSSSSSIISEISRCVIRWARWHSISQDLTDTAARLHKAARLCFNPSSTRTRNRHHLHRVDSRRMPCSAQWPHVVPVLVCLMEFKSFSFFKASIGTTALLPPLQIHLPVHRGLG